MYVIFGRRLSSLVVVCRCESGPGSCQEARSQAGGSVGNRVGSKPGIKSPSRMTRRRKLSLSVSPARLSWTGSG